MEKKKIIEVLNSGFKYSSGEEQLKGIINGIKLYYNETQNKAEFLINLRDFIEEDISQEFNNKNSTEEYILNKYNSIQNKEEKLAYCDLLNEITNNIKEDFENGN